MKNEKLCFSKQTGLIALVGVVIVGMVGLAIAMTSLPSTSTSTRASGCWSQSCSSLLKGSSGFVYYNGKDYFPPYDSSCSKASRSGWQGLCKGGKGSSGGNDVCCIQEGQCEVYYSGPGVCVSPAKKCLYVTLDDKRRCRLQPQLPFQWAK